MTFDVVSMKSAVRQLAIELSDRTKNELKSTAWALAKQLADRFQTTALKRTVTVEELADEVYIVVRGDEVDFAYPPRAVARDMTRIMINDGRWEPGDTLPVSKPEAAIHYFMQTGRRLGVRYASDGRLVPIGFGSDVVAAVECARTYRYSF